VIVVDGIIGAGKTVLINECLVPILSKRGLRITVIGESVEKWERTGRLKQFYENKSRRGYQFQTRVFHDRVKKSQKKFRKYKSSTDVFLLERSIFTDLLFMEMLYEDGEIDKSEYEDYKILWTMWEKVMPFKPDLFVYLKPDVDIIMKRVNERDRDGEKKGVPKSYQIKLQEKHNNFLGKEFVNISKSNTVPCFHLATNSNFKNDKIIQAQIADTFEDKIKFIQKSKF